MNSNTIQNEHLKLPVVNFDEIKNKDVIKKGRNFKKLTDKELKDLVGDVYKDLYEDEIIIDDLKNMLNEDLMEFSKSDRLVPKYVDGFLDAPFLQGGKPVREKDLMVYNTILSGNSMLVEIEGGVRGGKDVIALFSWSKYLMVCPDLVHLAIGSSLEHVLRTVLNANGFGLFYTIPHGIFLRESISGAQRGVYKFLDSYGREKTILFYGNAKENDSDKYQGFTLGSVYVNETLNQSIRGLEQAVNRISSAKQPLLIMTQNPKGESHDFYQKFEKPKLANDYDIELMEFIRDNYKEAFEQLETLIKKDRDKERKKLREEFYHKMGVPSYKYLDQKSQIYLNQEILEINYKYDSIIRNIPVQRFYPYLIEGDGLYNKSMKTIINFFKGFENVNNIKNAYNFTYFHYTIDDNMSVSEMARNNFKFTRTKGTATYDQEVQGLRRSSEGAVYSGFSATLYEDGGNLFNDDLDTFYWGDKLRVIVIDPGYNHPTGITDWAVDLEYGMVYQVGERKIDFKVEFQNQAGLDVIYSEFLTMVRKLRNRTVDLILIDPSKPEAVNYFRNLGWNVQKADNETWTVRGKEKETSFEIVSRDLRGIPLVQTAYIRRKILHHISCVETIKEVGSYSFKPMTESGKEDVVKLGDDLVDTVKYLMNSMKITPALWEEEESNGEEKEINKRRMGEVSLGESIQRDLERKLAEIYSGQGEQGQKGDEDLQQFFKGNNNSNFFTN